MAATLQRQPRGTSVVVCGSTINAGPTACMALAQRPVRRVPPQQKPLLQPHPTARSIGPPYSSSRKYLNWLAHQKVAQPHPLHPHPSQRVTRREMLIRRKRYFLGAINGAHPRTLNRNPPTAEGDLTPARAVTDRDPIWVVAALGPAAPATSSSINSANTPSPKPLSRPLPPPAKGLRSTA